MSSKLALSFSADKSLNPLISENFS